MDYKKVKGRIFDIQRYSIHDGTGIRTIIFFKGCALRCKWCCNPESQNYKIEEMNFDGEKKIIGRDVTVEELLEIVEKDRPYYRRSRGGVTLSGGEFLTQPDFAKALLYELKEHGFTTAVESMGYAEYPVIEGLLPYIDEYLLDIKHTDTEKHKLFTGKSNELMLENAKKIADSGLTKLYIRVPVIPTFNCGKKEIAGIAKFANELKGVERLYLLPYHRLGQDKYDRLGRVYELKNLDLLPDGYIEQLREVAKMYFKGDVQIGG